jgi:hypothetical protein
VGEAEAAEDLPVFVAAPGGGEEAPGVGDGRQVEVGDGAGGCEDLGVV